MVLPHEHSIHCVYSIARCYLLCGGIILCDAYINNEVVLNKRMQLKKWVLIHKKLRRKYWNDRFANSEKCTIYFKFGR